MSVLFCKLNTATQNPYSHICFVLFIKHCFTKPLLTYLFCVVDQTLLHKTLTHIFVLCCKSNTATQNPYSHICFVL